MLTAEDRIPVRALNQVTYCPRLYYLEYVDSVMPTNEYVEDGLFQHRRVNSPELANRTRKEGDVANTRSVSLSSERLGISGKLDVLEEREGQMRPVESKRSSAPTDADGRPTAWDNDAVQLAAQALLIEEEFGNTVSTGVLYYIGSKTRVDVPIDEALRTQTRAAIARIRKLAARDTPPEPLPAELRHRCYGCSLAPICLPEETLFASRIEEPAPVIVEAETGVEVEVEGLATEPTGETGRVARVIPASDDGAVLYLHEPGSHVGLRSERLVVRLHGQEIERVPIASIRQVVIFGHVQVSTQALLGLASLEVPVVYLTAFGRFVAALMPAPAKNVGLRAEQYRVFSDPSRALSLSREAVRAKVANQRTLLMRSLRTRSYEVVDEPARGRDEPAARDMADLLNRIDTVSSIESLLGLEGQAASLYFGAFNRMLRAPGPDRPWPFDFRTRNRRPPRDPVNCLLSFAYAILCKDCFSAACTVGFDPYQGFFHAGRHGKPSLALDLMEEFRAIVADSVVLTLINNNLLSASDFLSWRGSYQLTDAGRRRFFETYESRKATVVTHPTYGYKMSYGRMLEVQARMLAAYVRGDAPIYNGFTVR